MPTPLLTLTPPNRIRYLAEESAVGPTVYCALRAIMESGGNLTVPALCLAVWGTERVEPAAVWSLCHRLNAKLAAVHYPARVGSEEGRMLLC